MPKITLFGKIIIGLIIIAIVYFIALPVLNIQLPQFQFSSTIMQKGTPLIKVFVTSTSKESLEAITILRELSTDTELQGRFLYEIIPIDSNPQAGMDYNITSTPAFIIGTQTYYGLHEKEWFRQKIKETIQ